MNLRDLELSLVRLEDGTEVVGSTAAEMFESVSKYVKSIVRGLGSTQTGVLMERIQTIMMRLSAPSTEGVEELSMTDFTLNIEQEPRWMYRITDLIMRTTDVYKDLKAAMLDSLSDASENFGVTTTYDGLLDALGEFEDDILKESRGCNKQFLDDLGITDELRLRRYGQVFDPDATDLHKTAASVLRQYVSNLWRENYAGASGEIQQERLTRQALRFRQLNGTDRKISSFLESDKDRRFTSHDIFHTLRASNQVQLDHLSRTIGVPVGTFEDDPVSKIALSDYAPTTKAWKSAVRQVASGERSAMSIIKGWPGGEEYAKSKGQNPSQRKKKPKRSKKKKKGFLTSNETVEITSVNEATPPEQVADSTDERTFTEQTIDEEPEPETAVAASSTPSSGRIAPAKRKVKSHRRSKFEQMMASIDHGKIQSTSRTVTPASAISEDWNAIRTQVQAEFESLRSRLKEQARKDREYLGKLTADNASIAELRKSVTDASKVRGRRAGHRAPFVPSYSSRRAPTVVTRTKAKPTSPPGKFDTTKVTWPALSGSNDYMLSGECELPADSATQSNIGDDGESELTKKLSRLVVDDYSTAEVDPRLVELVTQFVPTAEKLIGVSGLSVAEVAGLMGGWDKARKWAVM